MSLLLLAFNDVRGMLLLGCAADYVDVGRTVDKPCGQEILRRSLFCTTCIVLSVLNSRCEAAVGVQCIVSYLFWVGQSVPVGVIEGRVCGSWCRRHIGHVVLEVFHAALAVE